jgi:hypothetical protein
MLLKIGNPHTNPHNRSTPDMSTKKNLLTVSIQVDYSNNAELWWDAAHASADCPAELRGIVHDHAAETEVPADRAPHLRAWCESLPGWAAADGATALIFD